MALLPCIHHAPRTLLIILRERTMRSQSGSAGDGAQWRRSNPISDPAKKTGGAMGLDGPSASSICATNRLIGSIEANLAFPLLEPTQANVSYGVFPAWRGNGIALRALRLMGAYLKSVSGMRQMVLRISCENAASLRVAEKSGFQLLGIFEEPEGRMVRYVFDLR